jgi:hypothetical protein
MFLQNIGEIQLSHSFFSQPIDKHTNYSVPSLHGHEQDSIRFEKLFNILKIFSLTIIIINF